MPPAKTIIVDVPEILRSIATQAGQQHTAAHTAADECRELWLHGAWGYGLTEERRQERAKQARQEKLDELLTLAPWVPRDLQLLAGKSLTASERIRHQQGLRKLEADGLVELRPRWVKLTDAGREYVAKLQGAAADG